MNVEVSGVTRSDIDEQKLAEFVADILERECVDRDSSLTISFVDTDAMAVLNAEHMNRNGPTDVLSFPIEDAAPGHPPVRLEGGPPLELGDVIICADVVVANADENGVAFDNELHLMVTHGVLHILGWDHQNEGEAEAMEIREAEHLATVGLARR